MPQHDKASPPASHDALSRTLDELRRRLEALAERDGLEEGPEHLPGFSHIARGLAELTEALNAEHVPDERVHTRVDVITQGLLAVVALFEDELVSEVDTLEEQTEATSQEELAGASRPPSNPGVELGLRQFISAFRNEARKRLSALSISMMTLFDEQTSERALDACAQHLHAIKGGAAMLTLRDVAEISGAMEQILLTMRKLPPRQRVWPTKTLMRGFRLLQVAADDEDAFLSPEQAEPVKEELHACFEELLSTTTLEELSRPMEEQAPQKHNEKPSQSGNLSDFTEVDSAPPVPPHSHELDLLEAARRAEMDSVTSADYDEMLAQTASLDGMEQRLLIVDDVEMIAASIGFVLSELELPMDIASNGEEAMEMLRERPYSLIISDIAMPRMDGVALTRRVRNEPALRDIPLILLTSLDHPNERDAGLEAGANDYIIKGSIGGGELVQRVKELLKIAPFVPSDAPARRPRWRILVAEDAETVAASIMFLLSDGDYDITLTSNGHEALTRLEREDYDLLLSDWQMPSMSGYELTQAVRASGHIRQIPIVLLTSLDSDKVREDARRAGADDFLVKGQIGGGALLQVIERLLLRGEHAAT